MLRANGDWETESKLFFRRFFSFAVCFPFRDARARTRLQLIYGQLLNQKKMPTHDFHQKHFDSTSGQPLCHGIVTISTETCNMNRPTFCGTVFGSAGLQITVNPGCIYFGAGRPPTSLPAAQRKIVVAHSHMFLLPKVVGTIDSASLAIHGSGASQSAYFHRNIMPFRRTPEGELPEFTFSTPSI